MTSPRLDPDKVRRAADIVAIVRRHVPELRLRSGRWWARCPFHDERTPSFSVEPRRGFFICFGCGARGDAIGFVMKIEGVGFAEALARVAGEAPGGAARTALPPPPRPIGRDRERDRQVAHAREIWRAARPIAGTPAARYLAGRGIAPPLPPTLRFHPALAYREDGRLVGRFPAMVAAMQDAAGRIVAAHRTWLQVEAGGRVGKAPVTTAKKMIGPAGGACIRLAPAGPVLALAEGIETALSVMQATGLPCWAAGSLGNLAGAPAPGSRGAPHPTRRDAGGRPLGLPSRLPDLARPAIVLPSVVAEVILCEDADNTDPAAADAEIARAVARLQAQGLRVRRARPPAGMDFNDLLVGVGGAEARECAA